MHRAQTSALTYSIEQRVAIGQETTAANELRSSTYTYKPSQIILLNQVKLYTWTVHVKIGLMGSAGPYGVSLRCDPGMLRGWSMPDEGSVSQIVQMTRTRACSRNLPPQPELFQHCRCLCMVLQCS
jgi:hypothetical protein